MGLSDPSTREAGAHAWKQAYWRLVVSIGILVAIFVGAGFGLAKSGLVGIGIGVCGLVALALLERSVEGGWLDALPWIMGYRGERTVSDLLAMLSPLGYKVVHGIPYTDSHGTHNIDHTVVGPSGIYAVETKNWTGAFEVRANDRLMHNVIDETRVVIQARREAQALKRILEERGVLSHWIWINAIVVSTKAVVPGPRARIEFKFVTVVGASDLVPYIRDRPHKLTADEIEMAVEALRAI
jgi:Nuclease-related domain